MNLFINFMSKFIELASKWRNHKLIGYFDSFLHLLCFSAIINFGLANQIFRIFRIRMTWFWLTVGRNIGLRFMIMWRSQLRIVVKVKEAGLNKEWIELIKCLFLFFSSIAKRTFDIKRKRLTTILRCYTVSVTIFWNSFLFFSCSIIVFDDSFADNELIIFWIILAMSFLTVIWAFCLKIAFWVKILSWLIGLIIGAASFVEKPPHSLLILF